tara:strand:+ start:1166 stop:1336 length:171 start_codon:yes stop_codon:yes gene_type:complete
MFGTKAADVENVTQTRRQPEREKVVAERINGQLAMLGLVAASVSYATTGHMFFGLV